MHLTVTKSSSYVILLLKHNTCLARMEKRIAFVIDIQVPVCLKKRFYQLVHAAAQNYRF